MLPRPLPNYYLITPNFDGQLTAYLQALENSLRSGIRLVQLRAKQLMRKDYCQLAMHTAQLVHAYQGQLILNAPLDLLNEIDADGIHLPSAQLLNYSQRPIDKDYILSVACHDLGQLQRALLCQADLALLSPIFKTPSCPTHQALGWKNFTKLASAVNFPIYALGGLKITDLYSAQCSGAYGIAAQRALWDLKNTDLK